MYKSNTLRKRRIYLFIAITIIILILIYFYLGKGSTDVWSDPQLLHRTNPELLTYENLDIDDLNFSEASVDWQVWNHMNITMKEALVYWNDNFELLNFFKSNYIEQIYLYSCTIKNKFTFECPKEWFDEFISIYKSDDDYVFWKNNTILFSQSKVTYLNSKNSIIFILWREES